MRVLPVYRVKQMAEDFGCNATTIYAAVKSGELRAFRLGAQLRIAGEDALKWRDAMRRRSGEAA
jgi:excisionase family DNA binding protein